MTPVTRDKVHVLQRLHGGYYFTDNYGAGAGSRVITVPGELSQQIDGGILFYDYARVLYDKSIESEGCYGIITSLFCTYNM